MYIQQQYLVNTSADLASCTSSPTKSVNHRLRIAEQQLLCSVLYAINVFHATSNNNRHGDAYVRRCDTRKKKVCCGAGGAPTQDRSMAEKRRERSVKKKAKTQIRKKSLKKGRQETKRCAKRDMCIYFTIIKMKPTNNCFKKTYNKTFLREARLLAAQAGRQRRTCCRRFCLHQEIHTCTPYTGSCNPACVGDGRRFCTPE